MLAMCSFPRGVLGRLLLWASRPTGTRAGPGEMEKNLSVNFITPSLAARHVKSPLLLQSAPIATAPAH